MIILSNYLFYLTPIASILTFIISLTIFLRPGGEPYLRSFSFFLFVNCCLDTSTSYMALNTINNVFLSNVNTMVTIGFYLYLLMEIVQRPKAKKVLLIVFIVYLLISMMNFFLVQKTGVFNSMTYCLGCLLIVTACIYYFWELFQQRESLNLLRQPAFWICSGLLFYCACSFPLQGMLNFMKSLPKVILENLLIIFDILNIFLYLSFSIAFLCRLKIKRSMSSF
jgi:hypothetical protein